MKKTFAFTTLLIFIFCSSPDNDIMDSQINSNSQIESGSDNESSNNTNEDNNDSSSNETGSSSSLSSLNLPYDPSVDYFGQKVDFYPFTFFASVLSQAVINGVNEGLKIAADEWGIYGPTEYWVLGTDETAAQQLANLYCERRSLLGQLWDGQTLSNCYESETEKGLDHNFEGY